VLFLSWLPNICTFSGIIKATVAFGTERRMTAMSSNIAEQQAHRHPFLTAEQISSPKGEVKAPEDNY